MTEVRRRALGETRGRATRPPRCLPPPRRLTAPVRPSSSSFSMRCAGILWAPMAVETPNLMPELSRDHAAFGGFRRRPRQCLMDPSVGRVSCSPVCTRNITERWTPGCAALGCGRARRPPGPRGYDDGGFRSEPGRREGRRIQPGLRDLRRVELSRSPLSRRRRGDPGGAGVGPRQGHRQRRSRGPALPLSTTSIRTFPTFRVGPTGGVLDRSNAYHKEVSF